MPISTRHRETSFGTIEIVDQEAVDPGLPTGRRARPDLADQNYRYTWTPPARLNADLPPGFTLALDCVVGADGVRRFRPACQTETFVSLAFVSGLAILNDVKRLDPETRQSYRAMWLVFGMVQSMREHNKRAFRTARDLYVRPSGRTLHAEWSLLPEDVGQDSDGDGRTWSIRELLDHGREAAKNSGIRNPNSAVAIPLGFVEAAKRNPLLVEPERVLPLVRYALFQINADQSTPGTAFVEVVAERLLRAVQRHLDESADDFNDWFSGPKSGLLSSLCSMKDEQGRKLRRDEVRQALLQLGWESYQYVAGCIQCAMRYVQNTIGLTEEERQLFEHSFLPQPYYGGLPLVLLAERAQLLKSVIVQIWQDPSDPSLVPILHRLLHYYAQIAERRRVADRRFKAMRSGTRTGGRLGHDVELSVVPHGIPVVARPEFSGLSEHLRELHNIHCHCDLPEYETYIESHGDGSLKFSWRCSCGREIGDVVISWAELREIAADD